MSASTSKPRTRAKERRLVGTKGKASKLLESRIMRKSKNYRKFTARQLYYILISVFGYTPGKRFYNLFDYHLSKLRRIHRDLHYRIIDPTRRFLVTSTYPFKEVELFLEKDAIRMVVESLAAVYKISIQVLRGFPSLSALRDALDRAKRRGVRKILYLGDWDPSGAEIERFAAREMGIEFDRVAVTPEQARRLRLPWIKVNRKDSRAAAYIQQYGDRAWELESLRPRTLLKIVEEAFKANVPPKFLRTAHAREKAATIAKPIALQIARRIESQVLRLLKEGKPEKEIKDIIASRFGLRGEG